MATLKSLGYGFMNPRLGPHQWRHLCSSCPCTRTRSSHLVKNMGHRAFGFLFSFPVFESPFFQCSWLVLPLDDLPAPCAAWWSLPLNTWMQNWLSKAQCSLQQALGTMVVPSWVWIILMVFWTKSSNVSFGITMWLLLPPGSCLQVLGCGATRHNVTFFFLYWVSRQGFSV